MVQRKQFQKCKGNEHFTPAQKLLNLKPLNDSTIRFILNIRYSKRLKAKAKKPAEAPQEARKRAAAKKKMVRRGELRVGFLTGQRGRPDKKLVIASAAILFKLMHTKLGAKSKVKNLIMPTNVEIINRIFGWVPCVPDNSAKLSVGALKRACYDEDLYVYDSKTGKKKEQKNGAPLKIVRSYMGFAYSDMNGNNKIHMDIFHRHLKATGLEELIYWIAGIALKELENPGSTDFEVVNKVFTEREKRAFNVGSVGPKAMDQKVDDDDLDAITTRPVAEKVKKNKKKKDVIKLKLTPKVEDASESTTFKKEEQVEEEETAMDTDGNAPAAAFSFPTVEAGYDETLNFVENLEVIPDENVPSSSMVLVNDINNLW